MSSIQPKSKLEEIANIFANESIKFDLKPFGEGSRLISKYRKSMNELMSSDPYEAYTGLGVLSAYENKYNLALQYFDAAQRLDPTSRSPRINIATCMLLEGDLDKCVDTLLNALNDFPNEPMVVSTTLKVLSMFFYFDEIDRLKGEGRNNSSLCRVAAEELEDTLDVMDFIKSTDIDLSVLRTMKVLANQEFFSKFSINSSYVSNYNVDCDDVKFDEVVYIPPELFGNMSAEKDSVIYAMNESLQEKFVDLMMHYSLQENAETLLKSFRNISIYFLADSRIKKS
ncbi:tetratricopeptide repeat protein [Acinetobacter lwoffii]|uniref:tetratricopeptide repeat protein n=1 Tax=Acinetobacter lwoffii TaxID=28090 RepID=UPI0035BC2F94|nr:hypothetical protein ABEDC_1054 [Acinetobacter lwoffii]